MSCSRFVVALVLLSCATALGALQTTENALLDPLHHALHRRRNLMASALLHKTMPVGFNSMLKGAAANAEEKCEWDDQSDTCYPSSAEVGDILKAGSDYSQLIAQFFVCDAAKDEDACNAAGPCTWAKEEGACTFARVTEGYDESPVVKDAPRSAEYFSETLLCPILDAQSCYEEPHCAWRLEEGKCTLELSRIFVGASSEEISAALQSVASQVRQKFGSEFDVRSPTFKAQSLLDWKIPETECPAESIKAACDFAKAMAASWLPVSYYCQLRHQGFFAFTTCFSDPLCQFDLSTFTCMHRSIQVEAALGKAYEASAAYIEQPGDKRFVTQLGECLEIVSADACTGDCMWYETEEESFCTPRSDSFFRMIAAPGKEEGDPLYYFFSALADSECFDVVGAEECSANPGCEWEQGGGCSTKFIYMISTAFDVDSEAAESYDERKEECAEHTSSDTCSSTEPIGSPVY